MFGGPISFSTSHLYLSALPFSPQNSQISKKFRGKLSQVLKHVSEHNLSWPVIQNMLHGHSDSVCSAAFSPDGKHIISGSNDKTIWLWDAKIGELLKPPLEGHKDWVWCVAFSPDGKSIVSGSADKTIRLWDAKTGEMLQPPLEGHIDCIWSVAFSPDGRHIVSGSNDKTIWLWDAKTGEMLQPPLEGHDDWVCSVAFSPDGKHIMSGSADKTIWLWDAETEEMLQPPLECYDLLLFHLIIYGLLFHFNVVYSATHSLHHFCVLLSFSSVIVHCTIHVFQLLWLIVYATHSFYSCSCTYISTDPSSSIDSS